MLPAIRPGDVLTIRRHHPEELHPGQVVLYSHNGRLTAHRVLSVFGGLLLTQGDSLPTMDLPVQAHEVVGRVVSIERNGRKLSPEQSFLQSMAAALIRRSEWCKRLYFRLSFKLEELELLESKFEF